MTLITVINNDLTSLIPIVFEYKDKIKKHILIYDQAQKEKTLAQNLSKNIERLNHKYSLSSTIELFEVDEDDKNDLTSLQKKLQEKLKECDIYLNASKSDTTLIVVFSVLILNLKGKIISYDKFDNSYNLISEKNFSNHKIKNNLSIDDFLLLMGYELLEEKEIFFTKEREKLLQELFLDTKKVFSLKKKIAKKSFQEDDRLVKTLRSLSKFDDIDYLDSKQVSQLGSLFEEYIYLLYKKYDFDDLKFGVKISFEENIKNEFDLFAIKDNHIYITELKLSTTINPIALIYKQDSILSFFGEDSKNLIINIQANLYNKTKLFGESSKKRAKINNIEIFNEYDLSTKKLDAIIKRFFQVKKRVFLLGGYDLEMIEIKKILKKENQLYHDKKLSWGATLSSYKEFLNDKDIFYGIELTEDITPPKHYIKIDHHNSFQNNPSSIEQIAKILNLKLSHFQKLVAINDIGHIKALKLYGANEDEIKKIRDLDRFYQGVSPKDEELAQKSIKTKKIFKDIVVIRSLTDKFSPIVDTLYGQNLLIYTDKKLTYYGRDIKKLIKKFKDMIEKNHAYYGGNFGFFGISEDAQVNIKSIKEKILLLLNG